MSCIWIADNVQDIHLKDIGFSAGIRDMTKFYRKMF